MSKHREVIDGALDHLSERHRKLLEMRLGLADGYSRTRKEIGKMWNATPQVIGRYEMAALRALEDPGVALALKGMLKRTFHDEDEADHPHTITLRSLVECVSKLTPYLITHLRNHPVDLDKLPWDVFEHLVAEFFASWGFEDVRLVGTDPNTAADIFAVWRDHHTGVGFRYFVEVKRWKRRVGVQVIDRIYGAMVNERQTFGWHVGMIVSLAGYSDTHKFTRNAWSRMGIELRDNSDIRRWLADYRPNKDGMWLPDPVRRILQTK